MIKAQTRNQANLGPTINENKNGPGPTLNENEAQGFTMAGKR